MAVLRTFARAFLPVIATESPLRTVTRRRGQAQNGCGVPCRAGDVSATLEQNRLLVAQAGTILVCVLRFLNAVSDDNDIVICRRC